MQETGFSPLRIAVFNALRTYGTTAYATPKRLLGYVLDEVDPDAPTTHVFEHNCDSALLQFYIDAASAHSSEAIGTAAQRATLLLTDERMLQHDVAEHLACELSFATAAALGVDCPESVRVVATQDVRAKSEHSTTNGSGGISSVHASDAEHSGFGSASSYAKQSNGSVSQIRGVGAQGTGGGQPVAGGTVASARGGAGQSVVTARGGATGQSIIGGSGSVGPVNAQGGIVGRSLATSTASGHGANGQSVAGGSAASARGGAQGVRATSGGSTRGGRGSQSAQTQMTAQPPATFSTNPAVRLAQAQSAGIGMSWHGFTKFWCAAAAIICAIFAMKSYGGVSISAGSGNQHVSGIFLCVLCICYFIAYYFLTKFKRGATAMVVLSSLLGCVPAGSYATLYAQSSESMLVLCGAQILMAFATLCYYSTPKRKALFSL